jgi:8-oxo-dGTP pyrophosphatase MutT (NUDIX family)
MSDTLSVQFAQKAVILDSDRILLVRKSSADPYNPGKWELPGGRLKAAESLDSALAREVQEELGLKVQPGRPLALWSWQLGVGAEAPTIVAVARLCELAGAKEASLDFLEHDDYIDSFAWFELGTVLQQDLIEDARHPISECLKCLPNV